MHQIHDLRHLSPPSQSLLAQLRHALTPSPLIDTNAGDDPEDVKFGFKKRLPTMMLYDELGLKLYEKCVDRCVVSRLPSSADTKTRSSESPPTAHLTTSIPLSSPFLRLTPKRSLRFSSHLPPMALRTRTTRTPKAFVEDPSNDGGSQTGVLRTSASTTAVSMESRGSMQSSKTAKTCREWFWSWAQGVSRRLG